jgi:polysaccharide export outer membrane protein
MNSTYYGTLKNSERAGCRRFTIVSLLLALPFLALSLLLTGGCQISAPPAYAGGLPLPPGPGAANYSTNLLEQGDTVSVTFQYSTNFNATQKIGLDGTLNLESVGLVKAAGKTPQQLETELARLYKPQIKDDIVTVKLVAAVSAFYVSGAVFRPGKITLERPMTILEGIMEAGGFDPNRAKLSDVTVLRIDDGRQHVYHVNLKQTLRGKDESPFYLRPFDVVYVPNKTFNF